MDSATEELYLQKIEEFVWDEDKIVTFTYLCRVLQVSSDNCRHLLQQFVEDCKQSPQKQLTITYLLIGLAHNGTPSLQIVSSEDLPKASSQLSNILHKLIYSIQKCKEINFNSIGLIDRPVEDNLLTNIPSIISSEKCVKRVFKAKKVLVAPPAKILDKTNKPSIFANVKPKPKEEKKEISNDKNSSEKTAPKQKTNGGLTNFFTKGQKEIQEIKPIPKEEEEKNSKSNLKRLVDSDSEEDFKMIPKQTEKSVKPPKKKQKQTKKVTEDSAKKRKRIVVNDSDSDDIFGDENERVFTSEDESPEPVKETPEPVKGINKRRKQVEKTYMDDDGFLLTKKEWIFESASEEEVEVKVVEKPKEIKETKEEKAIVENKGKAKVGKGKKKEPSVNQPTLMNFFKRK